MADSVFYALDNGKVARVGTVIKMIAGEYDALCSAPIFGAGGALGLASPPECYGWMEDRLFDTLGEVCSFHKNVWPAEDYGLNIVLTFDASSDVRVDVPIFVSDGGEISISGFSLVTSGNVFLESGFYGNPRDFVWTFDHGPGSPWNLKVPVPPHIEPHPNSSGAKPDLAAAMHELEKVRDAFWIRSTTRSSTRKSENGTGIRFPFSDFQACLESRGFK